MNDDDLSRKQLASIINEIVTNSCDAITYTMASADKAKTILDVLKICLLALILWRVW